MQIYSWNMLYRNARQDDAFHFISHADFDIFCLQEVPTPFLERLRTLPYHLASATDVERLLPSGVNHNHIVILSKYPITTSHPIPFPDYWPLLPFHTQTFVKLMPSRFFTRIRNRNALVADISHPTGTLRVFNLHLILAQPAWRLHEFELAMNERDPALPTIVCGDFNILEQPHITPLNWILGGNVRDALLFTRERMRIEQQFALHELTNVLRGRSTHPISRSQLDHILLSSEMKVEHAEVLADRHGSDHHPIHVEVTPASMAKIGSAPGR